MDLHVSRGACPVDFALRRSVRASVGLCAFLQPRSNAPGAVPEPIQYSPSCPSGQKLTTPRGIGRELTQLYEIGPFQADLQTTPAAGPVWAEMQQGLIVQINNSLFNVIQIVGADRRVCPCRGGSPTAKTKEDFYGQQHDR